MDRDRRTPADPAHIGCTRPRRHQPILTIQRAAADRRTGRGTVIVSSSLARRIGSVSCVVLLALIDGATAIAQTAAQNASAQAVRTDTRMTVDGALDEPAWSGAPVITGFRQRDPDEGQAATEQTEVRILYTSAGV